MNRESSDKWYRPRNYLHFDSPIGKSKAKSYVTNPKKVSSHAFFPLIKYEISTCKVSFDKPTNKLVEKLKKREIAYAGHLDSHILSYYAEQLTKFYEAEVLCSGLSNSIIAFRALGKSNVHFAEQAFSDIANRNGCTAIAHDVEGFFDNLDHALLKDNWAQLLKLPSLPADHYAIFRMITKYSSVDRAALYEILEISEHNPKASLRRRACSANEFRSKVRQNQLITCNSKPYGIPQGTPISALLSNIYMLDFDKSVHALVTKFGGSYYRYCDDILVIAPTDEAETIDHFICDQIAKLKLRINRRKTEIRIFCGGGSLLKAELPLQYLGFFFDGQRILLRSASLARYSQRMKKGIRFAKLTADSRNRKRANLGLQPKNLFKRKIYERYSHLGNRNFISYGYRAASILKSKAIRKQLKPLWGRLRAEILKDL